LPKSEFSQVITLMRNEVKRIGVGPYFKQPRHNANTVLPNELSALKASTGRSHGPGQNNVVRAGRALLPLSLVNLHGAPY
jgi:hypothetical protein